MPVIQPAIRAYLQVTLLIAASRRTEMVQGIYEPLRQRFLDRVPGAISKNLLLREEDVQILHGFDTLENARAYLKSDLFRQVSEQLAGYQDRDPIVNLYSVHD